MISAIPEGVRWIEWQAAHGRHLAWVAIANRHQALEAMFEGSTWERGIWTQAFLRASARAVRSGPPISFGKAIKSRAAVVPLEALVPERDPDEEATLE